MIRRRPALAALLALAGVLSACGQGAEPLICPPVVTVLDAGASPRQMLRLAPRVGARQAFDLTMHAATTQTLGEQILAPEISPAVTFSKSTPC